MAIIYLKRQRSVRILLTKYLNKIQFYMTNHNDYSYAEKRKLDVHHAALAPLTNL